MQNRQVNEQVVYAMTSGRVNERLHWVHEEKCNTGRLHFLT